MTKKQWQFLLILPSLLLILTGCGSDSDETTETSDDPLRALTFGEATLSATRRNAAPLVQFDTVYKYDYFLGVYKYAVTPGDNVVGTVKMPNDKDYDLYFYDTSGDRVAFIETAGAGVDETLSYTVGDFNTLYVVVYDPDADEDSTTEFELLMRNSTQITEIEPNDGPGDDSQTITGNYVTITGTVGQDIPSTDDYFSFAVNEGDTVSVDFSMNFTEPGFGSLSLYADTDEANSVAADNEVDDESPSGSFSYTVGTGISKVDLWVNMLIEASYTITVDISGEAIATPPNVQ